MQLLNCPLSSFGFLTCVVLKCCDILEKCTAWILRVTVLVQMGALVLTVEDVLVL
jgi:hypothetical protein